MQPAEFRTKIPSENKRKENELNSVMDCNDRFGQLGCGLFDSCVLLWFLRGKQVNTALVRFCPIL
jgi:hypothetical protein